MTSLLELTGREKVLEIGTGSGYHTAVLAELSRRVCSIERIPALAARARAVLEALGYANVWVRVGNGTLGWPEEAPFDRILVAAGGQAFLRHSSSSWPMAAAWCCRWGTRPDRR